MIAAIALLAVSCSKDQKTVNRLDGTWKANRFFVTTDLGSGDALALGVITEATYTFSDCKLKTDEWCTGSSSITYAIGDKDTDSYLYRVTEKGTVLETKDDNSSITINRIEIIEMTKTTLKVKQTDEDQTIEISLDKI